MKLYLIRHGQRGFGKNYDTLLPEGIWQAKQVGKFFKNKKIDMIYCSPQKRAKETLKAMAIKGRVRITERLRQQSVPEEVDESIRFLKKRDTPEQLTKRVRSFRLWIQKIHPKDTIVCITHKMFVKEFVKQITGRDMKIKSASISTFEYGGNRLIRKNINQLKYCLKDPNILYDAYSTSSKKMSKEELELATKDAFEKAKEGATKRQIRNAYLGKSV